LLTEGSGLLKDLYIDKGLSLANALMRRGFSKDQAAAIVGNIWVECTFDHTETGSGGDFGLLQWLGPRKKALQKFANKRKSSIMNLTTQLDFIKYELLDEYDGEYAYESNMFRKAMSNGDSIQDKAEGFARYSERPNPNALRKSLPTRKKVAQQIYDLLTVKLIYSFFGIKLPSKNSYILLQLYRVSFLCETIINEIFGKVFLILSMIFRSDAISIAFVASSKINKLGF
jgi:hypothetical protein